MVTKLWHLDDADLPAEFHRIRTIFLGPAKKPLPADLRKRNESLHDYLTRRSIKCPCRNCRQVQKMAAEAANETLL